MKMVYQDKILVRGAMVVRFGKILAGAWRAVFRNRFIPEFLRMQGRDE